MHSFWLGHQPSPFNAPLTTGGLFTVHFCVCVCVCSVCVHHLPHSFRVAIVTKQDGHTRKNKKNRMGCGTSGQQLSAPSVGKLNGP